MKDRKQTERDIIDAVDAIAREEGISKLGVNAVAKKAGVSKVLIYRYFGGLDELIEAWALDNSYWVGRVHDEGPTPNNISDGLKILRGQAEAMRKDPMLRELERWLLAENSPAGDMVMEKLEQRGTELTGHFMEMAELSETASQSDIAAFIAVVTAGINYLALKGDRCTIYNGVRLDTDEGWERISSVIEQCAKCILS